jgi:uncharacterized protein
MNFERLAARELTERLAFSPAVAILGARQVGKTTLATEEVARRNIQAAASGSGGAVYLDLETAQARARLQLPGAFFAANRGKLVVLDEVQFVPDLFNELRGEIDADRRVGRFLLLGSASFKLLRQSQSLAGRLALVDMAPLLLSEVQPSFADSPRLWLRGGFPGSYLAPSDRASWAWRDAFIRHFLHTDLAALGVKVNTELLQRFWRMCAHLHGQLFNGSAVAASLGISAPTVTAYLDLLCASLMLRRLEPYHANFGKRLVKSPKVYVRDSGLLHFLLGIKSVDDLLGHPSTGASWEGFVVEQICSQLPLGAGVSFYRTAAGAELDVVVELGDKKLGFEVKFSSVPKVTKGFWQACTDLGVTQAYVVAPVEVGWPMEGGVEVISPAQLPQILAM